MGLVRVLLVLCVSWAPCLALDVGFEKAFTTETTEVHDLHVKFDRPVPEYLRGGSLMRNGLGRFEFGERKVNHMFDGFTKIFSWKFLNESSAAFSTKFIKSKWYKESKRKNDIVPYMLFGGVTPDFGQFEKYKAFLKGGDNYPISIHRFGPKEDATYATLTDEFFYYSFDPDTLDTIEKVYPPLPGPDPPMLPYIPSSSHPLPEPGTDNLITFAILNYAAGNDAVRLIRITSGTGREEIADIPMERAPYMHSFGLSQNYAVIMAAPMFTDIEALMKTAQPLQSLDWRPELGMTLYVVNLHTKDMFAVKTETKFPMHFVNSYEEGDFVYIDYIAYTDMTFISAFMVEDLLDPIARNKIEQNCEVTRFAIDVVHHTVELIDMPLTKGLERVNNMDLPTVNPNYLYKPHCYVWGISVKADGENFSVTWLGKKNLCEPEKDMIWYKENHYPAEPIFVPNPDGTEEDDGVLLSNVMDGEKGTTYLGVFDARTMELISQSYLPFHFPSSIHGIYFDGI